MHAVVLAVSKWHSKILKTVVYGFPVFTIKNWYKAHNILNKSNNLSNIMDLGCLICFALFDIIFFSKYSSGNLFTP